jgi:hypothetical protein
MSRDLTEAPVQDLIRKMALPASIGFFFNTMYNVVDTYFGGQISTTALAAKAPFGSNHSLVISHFPKPGLPLRCRSNALGKHLPKKAISSGVVHKLPADLRKALTSDKAALAGWEDITPLARNEWICWTTSVKKDETRKEHVERVRTQLKQGKRRPCCWPGCPHR